MKSLKLAVVAISLIGIFGVGNAMASGTAQVDVTATVLAACSFATGNPQMAFGSIDPSSGDTYDATAVLNFTCTKDTDATLSSVANTYEFSQGNLFYTVAAHALTATGTGSNQTVTLEGSIIPSQYELAPALAPGVEYTHTLYVNITP